MSFDSEVCKCGFREMVRASESGILVIIDKGVARGRFLGISDDACFVVEALDQVARARAFRVVGDFSALALGAAARILYRYAANGAQDGAALRRVT